MQLFTIILMGRSGCGKGTQGKLLIEELKRRDAEHPVLYIETGENFRKFLTEKSFTAHLSREIYERGELQPEFLAVRMWSRELAEHMTGTEHLVLDGTPRKQREALVLDTALSFYQRPTPIVIHLTVSNEWSRQRMLDRKRVDDVNSAEVEKRLAWFDTDVQPAIDWYRSTPGYRFVEIDGERTIEDIQKDVVQAVFNT